LRRRVWSEAAGGIVYSAGREVTPELRTVCHPEQSEGSWFLPGATGVAAASEHQGPSLRSG
jgi:hypothetical protein